MKVIYIAGPFRGSSSWDIHLNCVKAMTEALFVWHHGGVALCPHANTIFYQGAAPDNMWLIGDLELLRRCDAVYMIPGWSYSVGACGEYEEAQRVKMPVLLNRREVEDYLDSGN